MEVEKKPPANAASAGLMETWLQACCRIDPFSPEP